MSTPNTEQLLEWLPQQRWFGGKGRAIEAIETLDVGILEDGPPTFVLALLRVQLAGGSVQLYHLPLLVEEDGTTREVLEDLERLKLLGELLAHGATIKGDVGAFFFLGPGLNPLAPPATSVRLLSAEQSNTSFVLDDTVIVKLFRRVENGANPDLELTRLLTDLGFDHVAPHVGELTYEGEIDDDDAKIDLAIAQQFVRDAVEGWTYTLQQLRGFFDAVHPADVPEDRVVLTEERVAGLLQELTELGEVTGAFHVALAGDEIDPDVLPEEIGSFDLNDWARAAEAALDREVAATPSLQPLETDIRTRIARLKEVQQAGLKTRIHGDYHLGQVLLSPRGWLLIDLEGEPARSLDYRREKQSPLRDVAGMLRSFSYAAMAALFERCEPASEEWQRLEPWADTWETLARDRFLSGYLRKCHEGRFLPTERDVVALLIDIFEIDKALYELGYERSHRPDWVRIPLRGIEKVLGTRT